MEAERREKRTDGENVKRRDSGEEKSTSTCRRPEQTQKDEPGGAWRSLEEPGGAFRAQQQLCWPPPLPPQSLAQIGPSGSIVSRREPREEPNTGLQQEENRTGRTCACWEEEEEKVYLSRRAVPAAVHTSLPA